MNTSEKEKQIIKATIQFKRGTTAAWEANSPILAAGEPGFNLDTKQIKIGDGIHQFNELPSISGSSGTITAEDLINLLTNSSALQETVGGIASENLELKPLDPANTSAPASAAAVYEALAAKQDTLEFDNQPTANSEKMVKSGGIFTSINEVVQVAQGKTACYVFDTTEDLDTWLADSTNTAILRTGDVFLIRDVDVPDWWWDGTTQTKQRLETTKVDLTNYALKTEIPTKTSQLTNNSGFLTQHQSLANVNAAKVNGYNIVVSNTAPTNASNTTITIVVPN